MSTVEVEKNVYHMVEQLLEENPQLGYEDPREFILDALFLFLLESLGSRT